MLACWGQLAENEVVVEALAAYAVLCEKESFVPRQQ